MVEFLPLFLKLDHVQGLGKYKLLSKAYWRDEEHDGQKRNTTSWYQFACIQSVLEKRDKFGTQMEFEIKSSRLHHGEVVDIATC
jgi:hypothetical protein